MTRDEYFSKMIQGQVKEHAYAIGLDECHLPEAVAITMARFKPDDVSGLNPYLTSRAAGADTLFSRAPHLFLPLGKPDQAGAPPTPTPKVQPIPKPKPKVPSRDDYRTRGFGARARAALTQANGEVVQPNLGPRRDG